MNEAEKYLDILHMINEMVILADENGNIYFINHAAKHFFKSKHPEAQEFLLNKLFSNQINFNEIKHSLLNTSSISKEIEYSDNKIKSDWILWKISTYKDQYLFLGKLITKEHSYSTQINSLAKEMETILDSTPGKVYWKDLNSHYVGANKEWLELAGINSRAELAGKRDEDFFGINKADALRFNDKRVIETGKTIVEEEAIKLKNGETRYFIATKMPRYDENGNIIGIIGNSIDITDKKELEKKLVQAKEEAELANQAKTEFMRNMRHDLRTPLYGITGLAGKILSETSDSFLRNDISDIQIAGNQLLNLLNQILSYIETESKELPIRQEIFSLKELLDNLVGLLKPSLIDKSLNFTFNYDKKIPDYLISDIMRIHRVILNILSNAIKFTDKQGSVSLTAEMLNLNEKYHSCEVRISVQDSGIGIPKEDINNIFVKFNRLHSAYEGKYKGSGLGLSIVEQFMDELDAVIQVDSTPGKGTLFSCLFTFKISEPPSKSTDNHETYTIEKSLPETTSPQNTVQHESIPSSDNKKRILLVEDNAIVARVILSTLQKLDYLVDLAINGEEAISLTHTNRYDIIFMDIGLPGDDGFEVTKKIRMMADSPNKNTPIIAQTAHLDDNQKQKGNESGMNDMIEKPLTQEKVQRLVEEFTETPHKLSH